MTGILRVHCAATALLIIALLAGGCGGRSLPLARIGGNAGGAALLTALPPLPGGDAPPRAVSAEDSYTFVATDVHDSLSSSMTDTALTLEEEPRSWAVLALDVSTQAVLSLDFSGDFSELYIGVSDYARRTWQWLGGPHGEDGSLLIPTGHWSSAGEVCYFVVACPAGQGAVVELTAHLSPPADWNLLVWMAADNWAAQFAADDISALEEIGSTAEINVLVGCDIDPGALDAPVAGTDEVHYFKLVQDSDPAAIDTDGDEANVSFPRAGYSSADPDNLVDFLEWAEASFPARQSMLILGRSGTSWWPGSDGKAAARVASGVLYDESDGPDDLTSNHLVARALGIRWFDLLGFEGHNMSQIETLYDYSSKAGLMVAAQDWMPEAGWAYGPLLQYWNDNYPLTPLEIGQAAADAYAVEMAGEEDWTNMAVVSSAGLRALTHRLAGLAPLVLPDPDAESWAFGLGAEWADSLDDNWGVRDLWQFMDAYFRAVSNPAVEQLLADAIADWDTVVLYDRHSTDSEVYEIRGLSIWLPGYWAFEPYDRGEYAKLPFNDRTDWLTVLEALSMATAGVPPSLVWEPGDTFVVEWDDPALTISPQILIWDVAGGTPEEPDDLAGWIEFSDPSGVSGTARETATLLGGAPTYRYLARVTMDWPAAGLSYLVNAHIEDSEGGMILDFGTRKLTGAEEGYDWWPYATLNHAQHSIGQSGWEVGDRVEISWPDDTVDIDIFVMDPVGGYGECDNTWEIFTVRFSDDSRDSGLPLEWTRLEENPPPGSWTIEVQLRNFDDPPVSPQPVSVRLYDESDTLKQELTAVDIEVNDDNINENVMVALLSYGG